MVIVPSGFPLSLLGLEPWRVGEIMENSVSDMLVPYVSQAFENSTILDTGVNVWEPPESGVS